jgi:hypothetical protein
LACLETEAVLGKLLGVDPKSKYLMATLIDV